MEENKGYAKGESAFARLPDEIITQILQVCDPNSFASLVLLNSRWRAASQQSQLYARHLLNCPSFNACHPDADQSIFERELPELRSLFAHEVKRNLCEAYLRPRETYIKLVSTTISSSAAFPGGEAFNFAFSPQGRFVLAYSSSRLYILDVTGADLAVKRELKLLRRPLSTTILDDGSLLAILSIDHQVDLYDLSAKPPKRSKTLELDNQPRTIALSPTGTVLAAAYDGGIEVYSLLADDSSPDRRGVKCDAVDNLMFSPDGTQLLGSTLHSRNPSTVILTAPYWDPGSAGPDDNVGTFWTTSILFPNSSRDCSHSTLLPNQPASVEANWIFAYDRVFETFRAVRTDDLRNGTTYFTGPVANANSVHKLLPTTLPTANDHGELVAAGFQGKEIWLYGVPEDLDALPTHGQNRRISGSHESSDATTPQRSLSRRNSHPSPNATHRRESSNNRVPQWQLLESVRNLFVRGREVARLDGVSAMKWVADTPARARLVAVAPGVAGQLSEMHEDGIDPIDGGRLTMLDFAYRGTDGEKRSVVIEVGDNEAEILEEGHRDLDAAVAVVRRRTLAQRRRIQAPTAQVPAPTAKLAEASGLSSYTPSLPSHRSRTQAENPSTLEGVAEDDHSDTVSADGDELFDSPYSQTAPRSGVTLRRAATAVAVNRRFNPPQVPDAVVPLEFRRPGGRIGLPHESDADNWQPPPPPYSREPIEPLPFYLRNAILSGVATNVHMQRSNSQRSEERDELSTLQRSATVVLPSRQDSQTSSRRLGRLQRRLSESSAATRTSNSDTLRETRRSMITSPTREFDPLYDVSPPDSPAQRPAVVGELPHTPTQLVGDSRPTSPVSASSRTSSLRNSTTNIVMSATISSAVPEVIEPDMDTPEPLVDAPDPPVNIPQPVERDVEPPQPIRAAPTPPPNRKHDLREQIIPSSSEVSALNLQFLPLSTPPANSDMEGTETANRDSDSRAPEVALSYAQETPEEPRRSRPVTPKHSEQGVDKPLPPRPSPQRAITLADIGIDTVPPENKPSRTSSLKRNASAPDKIETLTSNDIAAAMPSPSAVGLPSAAQLASLGSRKGRPRNLSDPSRRNTNHLIPVRPRAGSNTYPSPSSSSTSLPPSRIPPPQNPSSNNSTRPRPRSLSNRSMARRGLSSTPISPIIEQATPRIDNFSGFTESPQTTTNPAASYPLVDQRDGSAGSAVSGRSRRSHYSSSTDFSLSTPELRPTIERLETIHSVATNDGDAGEVPPVPPVPHIVRANTDIDKWGIVSGSKEQAGSVGRSGGRNLRKRARGWGGGTVKKKRPATAQSSKSAPMVGGSGEVEGGRKKDKKCVVM